MFKSADLVYIKTKKIYGSFAFLSRSQKTGLVYYIKEYKSLYSPPFSQIAGSSFSLSSLIYIRSPDFLVDSYKYAINRRTLKYELIIVNE